MKNDRIVTPLGDRHNGDQTTLIAEGGRSWIRKPRNAETERRWRALLEALRSAGLTELPGCVELLSEGSDWHTEAVVEHRSCEAANLPAYYRRCGVLLFFAWLFGADDLHCENLVADRDVPVPVDLETLLSGVPERTSEAAMESLAWSVYRTHLLPNFSGRTDLSGFTGRSADGKNIPLTTDRADGEGLPPETLSEYIADGFTEAFRFADAHRELLAEQIRGFGVCRFRVLLRPTELYGKFLSLLELLPAAQRKAAAKALILPAYQKDADPDRVQKAAAVIREECAALERGDVPLFSVRGDGVDLLCGNDCVLPGYLCLSPVDFSLQRLGSLSESVLAKQRKLIALAYDALRPIDGVRAAATDGAPRSAGSRERLSELVAELERCAVPLHPSAFIRLAADGSGRLGFQSAGWGLYDGLAGILCAYGAVYRRTGDRSVLEKLLTKYAPMANALLSGGRLPVSDAACALADGLGGIIACLLHLSALTGLPRFAEDAAALAARLDPERITVHSTDLLNGAGGLCLQLPKLPPELAVPLARGLLPLFRDHAPSLTGLAHGAAGQALCLGALQRVLQEEALREPILRLLRWENALYDPQARNWPDLRDGRHTGFMGGWCAGAPGIGLARKKLAEYEDDPEIAAICLTDVERAAAWLDSAPPARKDVLCCGNGARLLAACRLGAERSRWLQRVSAVRSADSPGLLHPLDTADRNAGLMQGLAGAVYLLALWEDPICGELLL